MITDATSPFRCDASSRRRGLTVRAAAAVLFVVFVVCASGCATHRVLSTHTISANQTVADIYYQQTIDNVARFVANPATMPSFSIVTSGTVNIEDVRGASLSPNYSPSLTRGSQGGGALPILSLLFGASAQRSLTENWSTNPVTDSDNLRRLRCAFQIAVGAEGDQCGQCKERLEGFFFGGTETYDCLLPQGWFNTGCKEDVPENACYVGHYCDTYVWVTADNLDAFTRFTITILDIATGEIHAPQRTVVKRYKGEPKPENLESTEVTSIEPDADALKGVEKFHLDRQRMEAPMINRGLFFVPR